MKRHILFFTVSNVPTEREKALAASVGGRFRAACFVNPSDKIEPCDGAAGAVPQSYIDAGVKVIEAGLSDEDIARLEEQRRQQENEEVQKQIAEEERLKQEQSQPPQKPENTPEGAQTSTEFANNGWGQPRV